MTILALLPSPIPAFVLDHHGCRHRQITISSRSHAVLHSTRTLASAHNWNIEISKGLLPQTSLADVADLLAAAFGDSGGDDDGFDVAKEPLDFSFKLRLMAALQFRALTEGRQYITVLARSADTGNVAGVVTVAPGLGPADAEGHLKDVVDEDQTIASISNMAVEENSRRQGLGKILLETVEVVSGGWPVPPSLFVLSVYRTNEAAIGLYKKSGYLVDESWIDPKWLRAAERGLASGSRRSLMIKRVSTWETWESENEEDQIC
jgi:ribosomal protein S18 acetylase RimI-like enzyme